MEWDEKRTQKKKGDLVVKNPKKAEAVALRFKIIREPSAFSIESDEQRILNALVAMNRKRNRAFHFIQHAEKPIHLRR